MPGVAIGSGAGAPIAAANFAPVRSGMIGSSAPHSTSFGRGSSRSASSVRCPAAAPSIAGSVGSISGKARAPAFDAGVGKGAS